MNCFHCGSCRTIVVDSRTDENGARWRRRACKNCKRRFRTCEAYAKAAERKASQVDAAINEAAIRRLRYECDSPSGKTVWAKRHGVSVSYVSLLIKGERKPSPRIIAALGFLTETPNA